MISTSPQWIGYAQAGMDRLQAGAPRGDWCLDHAWVPALGVTGTTLFDMMGRKAHGTLTNMDPATDWRTTKKGWALDFDGSNDAVIVSDVQAADYSTGPFSFGAVVELLGNSGVDCLLGKGDPVGTASNSGYGLYYNGTVLRPFIRDGSTRVFLDTSPVATGTWYTLLCVVDRANQRLRVYANGVEIGSGDISSVGSLTTSGRFSIGSSVDGDTARPSKMRCAAAWTFRSALTSQQSRHLHVDPLLPLRRQRTMIGKAPTVPPPAPPAVAPYRVAMGRIWLAGSAAGERSARGAIAGQSFNTGQTAGQIDGRCN